ncbi:Uncharacterized protein K02A2.6 [Stylophora pistillata]|uniref:Uncharacterized protein K02A2.6 n=1 Tax=Stylophora pistillata TaxID=50429 RepID=A0A2B4RD46_STYPI|nr:Uncharacterized protein K02A2.6 [Stylophora pistillata]
MELSQKQAANIEETQTVNKLSSLGSCRSPRNCNAKAGTDKDGGRATDKKLRNRKSRGDSHKIRKSSDKCRNCGGDYPHPEGKTFCPARASIKILDEKNTAVKGSSGSLLSWKTSQELSLLQTVQQVKLLPSKLEAVTPSGLIAEYDDLFHGLGKLKNYQIKLHIDEEVTPIAQPHRRVPFHVRKQLEGHLERDEELGVIEHIKGHKPWVSPIVVASKPKSPGKVRVCVDMRQANKAVKRERHVTPTVKEMIGDLNGARVLSNLDLNQGYNQLEQAPESRYNTIFSTHMGLMRYERLNFGISSAAEIFQSVIRDTLEGIEGAINISDDISVFRNTLEEHDQSLKAVFQRLRKKGLTLNKRKCEYRKEKLEFFGYVFSRDGISPDPKKVADVEVLDSVNLVQFKKAFRGNLSDMLVITEGKLRFVRTVKNIVKTVRLEHKSYKQELDRMLRSYRATPHGTLRVAPAVALFGRLMKTKLPEMMTPCSDNTAIRRRDQAVTAEVKEQADNKRYTKPSAIKEGDIVLIKRDETKKKDNTSYNPIPRTVIKTKGFMVTAENAEGVPITRNSSFFKSVPDFKISSEEQENSYGDGPPLQLDGAPARRYPQRARTRPAKLSDYVLD